MEYEDLQLSLKLGRSVAVSADGEEEVSVEQSATSGRGGWKRSRERVEVGSDNEDGAVWKKLRLNKEQAAVLEQSFKDHPTLNPNQKLALAKQLSLRPRQVEVWFQNRRARTKMKQTEVDCAYLKRWFETLTEENRQLQREVMELRALKRPPHLLMHMSPPTTLTLCPSCERVEATEKPAASLPFRRQIRL